MAVAAYGVVSVPASSTAVYCGRVWPGVPAPGVVATLTQTNSLTSINPRDDSAANPNYPSAPPWEPSATGWITCVDYGGWAFASDLGSQGSLITWAGAGHSAVNALCVIRYDMASNTWSIHGPKPIPSNALLNYTPGSPPSGFNESRGDWTPDDTSFPLAFRQPLSTVGYRVEGGHQRNRQVYVPAALAGNGAGWLVLTHRVGGVNDAVGTMGASHYIDLDDGKCYRFSTTRPDYGALQGAAVLHPTLGTKGVISCNNQPIASTSANYIDYLDVASGVWTRRSYTSGGYGWQPDDGGFAWVDGSGHCWHIHTTNVTSGALAAFAVDLTTAVSAGSLSNVGLTLSYTTLPSASGGSMASVCWARRASNGCYYAVSRTGGTPKTWKLTPPVSGVITDTWTITEESLSGASIVGKTFDYQSLLPSPDADSLVWVGGNQTSVTLQYVRPA